MTFSMRLARLLMGFVVLSSLAAAASDPSRKALFLAYDDVYSVDAEGHIRQLTFDSVRKWLPVWSPDGRRIAFMRDDPKNESLGHLVVITDSGKRVADIPVQPAGSGPMLQYVEAVQWLNASRIAAGGAVNPSTGYFYIFDVHSGKDVDGVASDDINPAFSPDGNHDAGFLGSPHFAPDEDKEPYLEIDGKRIYPAERVKVIFRAGPLWSQDSSKLAVVAQDEKTNKTSLVIWRSDGPLLTIALPVPWNDLKADLFWQGNTLMLQAAQCVEKPVGHDGFGWDCTVADRAWKLADDLKALLEIPTDSFRNSVEAAKEAEKKDRQAMLSLVNKAGGSDPDVWCKDCALAQRPRKASTY